MNNPNTINTTYDELRKQVSQILSDRGAKKDMLSFSMFDSDDDDNADDWKIKIPDFNAIFSEGKVKFVGGRRFKSRIIENPTWSDAVYWANESILWGMKKEGLDGWDHVFLEGVDFKKEIKSVKVFEFWFGS